MAFARSGGIFQKMTIFWLKKCFFLQSAVNFVKIGKNADFVFPWKKTGSKLSESVGFTKIGPELAIWRFLEVGAYLVKNHQKQRFKDRRCHFGQKNEKWSDLPQLQVNAKSRVLSRFWYIRRILKVWNLFFNEKKIPHFCQFLTKLQHFVQKYAL